LKHFEAAFLEKFAAANMSPVGVMKGIKSGLGGYGPKGTLPATRPVSMQAVAGKVVPPKLPTPTTAAPVNRTPTMASSVAI